MAFTFNIVGMGGHSNLEESFGRLFCSDSNAVSLYHVSIYELLRRVHYLARDVSSRAEPSISSPVESPCLVVNRNLKLQLLYRMVRIIFPTSLTEPIDRWNINYFQRQLRHDVGVHLTAGVSVVERGSDHKSNLNLTSSRHKRHHFKRKENTVVVDVVGGIRSERKKRHIC